MMERKLARINIRKERNHDSGSFAPGVVVDGQTVYPPAWMRIVGFAIGGAEWALFECNRQNWKGQARKWFAEQGKGQEGELEIRKIEIWLAVARKELQCRQQRSTEND